MSYTLVDLFERLKQEDEISLLEILNISAEDIVDRFQDIIEAKADELEAEFLNEENEDTFSG